MKKVNINRKHRRGLRHDRLLKKIKLSGNSRPRLIVTKTNMHIYAQIIDDEKHNTLVYVSSSQWKKSRNATTAKLIGEKIGEEANKQGITALMFDRNGQKYSGVIKIIADAVREKGINL